MALESVLYPGEGVGIAPDGSLKIPSETSANVEGQFFPTVVGEVRCNQVTGESKFESISESIF